jgi:hypothetical protein
MNKRGQFYLIAALVIAGLIISLSYVYIKTKTVDEDKRVYDLADEIKFEVNQVIDSGIFNSLTSATISDNVENLTDYYSGANPDLDLIVIIGDASELNFFLYKNPNTSQISLLHNSVLINVSTGKTKQQISRQGNEVLITFGNGVSKNLQLNAERVVLVLIKKEAGGERFIAM